MFYHGFDSATGEFLFCGHDPETGEVARLTALGQVLVAAPGWDSCQKREDYNYLSSVLTPKPAVTLVPDKAVIAADGTDQAVVAVAVAGESPPASIQITVDGVPAAVALTNGQGQVPPIVSAVEHVFAVRVADQITFQDGGGCAVAAQEQE